MINWETEDQERALAEGWGIFDNSDNGMRIERFDDAHRFDSDAAAVAFVGLRAALGNPLARKAFEQLAWHHSVDDAAIDDVK